MAKKPLRTLEDWKGKIIGIPGGKVLTNFTTALGASPEIVGSADAYSALEKGLIEGYNNPYSFRYHINCMR